MDELASPDYGGCVVRMVWTSLRIKRTDLNAN